MIAYTTFQVIGCLLGIFANFLGRPKGAHSTTKCQMLCRRSKGWWCWLGKCNDGICRRQQSNVNFVRTKSSSFKWNMASLSVCPWVCISCWQIAALRGNVVHNNSFVFREQIPLYLACHYLSHLS